jgi:putative mRNA 3-end processing factor
MDLRFLGGAGEVGRSAILVDDRLLLDFGLLAGNPPLYPVDTPDVEAVVVSHGHLDHAGAVPSLLKGRDPPDIHWTPPTGYFARTLAEDTLKLHEHSPNCPFTKEEVLRIGEVEQRHGFGEPFEAAGFEVTFFEAGHIPGSAHVLVDDGETRFLYTGDFHTGRGDEVASDANGHEAPVSGQRLVSPSTARPDADVVLCESTYANVDHDERRAVERRWAEDVRTTLQQGGSVVVPAFAIGRTQELLLVADAHDVTPFVDGMGAKITRALKNYPEFVRDPEALRRATSNARFVGGDGPGYGRDGQRERIVQNRNVVVTTSGMLSGGPAMTYVPAIRTNPTNRITMTGYQVEGTPGRDLLERGRCELNGRVVPVSAQYDLYDFSAHADREGLREFLGAYKEAEILVNHGDDCAGFAERLRADGFDASAPELGETLSV